MFHSARIKLTSWYLLIIMLVSLSFSGFIYARVCREFERGFRRMELRHKAEEMGIPLPRFFSGRPEELPLRLREAPSRYFFTEDFEEAKRRVLFNLLIINGAILTFSAFAGYFLAGKTLKPIENALEEQKRFVADASHELRTPLTALKTSMEVALRGKNMSLSQAKDLIKGSLEDINSMQSLANKLLSLATYQSNGQSLVFKELDIAKVMEEVSRKISPLAKEKEIEMITDIKSQNFQVNEESLEEMLLIFLDNAVKYTPKGGKVMVMIEMGKKLLVIKVKDTGIGITKEDLPHIFDRFYRADQSRTRSHLRGGPDRGGPERSRRNSSDSEEIGGFGLGLSLAKKIIEIHKGTVEVDSVLGKGTTFTITLPLKHA